MQKEDNARPRKSSESSKSTRDHVIDDRRAEILAGNFNGVFSAVDIRENLEGEPVAKAWGLLEWAAKKRQPRKALRAKAKKDSLGHYRPQSRESGRPGKSTRSDASEEYRRYMAFVGRKQEESLKKRGRPLFCRELEDLAHEFYAPEYRAELEKISPEAWDAFHRELEEEGVA